MNQQQFQRLEPKIIGNNQLREPQVEAYRAVADHFSSAQPEREVGIVLPVGCGKSGLITIAPFALKAKRVLVIAPGLNIADQLERDFNPGEESSFYQRFGVLAGSEFPEPAELRGDVANLSDLQDADVVITNIQQLQGGGNRWLGAVDEDFFDLILVDEAHHNVAESWEAVRRKFPAARIINVSATPTRADGQLMAGKIIYSYPVFRAIAAGYVKRLKAVVLNPRTLRYVRLDNGVEREVPLDEVIRLGEEDADFRRSIVSSAETLRTIVDASIRELNALRNRTGENRHKIIASALNYQHCIQITRAYQERGLRAAYVHSREESEANRRVIAQLENHELDAVVQVRKLGEGFDHRYLSVAAVCSIFGNLSPFVQFVGRVMRAIAQNEPDNPVNEGVVVFHAGSNISRRWSDFQSFSKADQEYFDQLLPLEGLDFETAEEIEVTPRERSQPQVDIRRQTEVALQEIPLLEADAEAQAAIELLRSRGYTPDQVAEAMLKPVLVTKQRARIAARQELDALIRTETGRVLAKYKLNPKGYDLDRTGRRRENFVVLKSAMDKRINALVGRKAGDRQEFTREQLEIVMKALPEVVESASTEVLNGKA